MYNANNEDKKGFESITAVHGISFLPTATNESFSYVATNLAILIGVDNESITNLFIYFRLFAFINKEFARLHD
ncbi:MAG: hypothetical protein ACRD6U_12310 [Nitrososphaeraceae archaeon]